MPDDRPLVSILMNCRNGARYLRAAIESVLAQTYQNWELVFWDNQSTDSSAAICKSYPDSRIKYFRSNQDTNLGCARALAMERARGDFIAILDVDDLWVPQKLERQMPLFDGDGVGIVISDTLFFTDDGKERQLYKRGLPPQGWVFHELVSNYFVSLETVVLRRTAIESVGQGFDATFSHICDLDLIIRISQRWKLACVGEVLGKWRVHPYSASWVEPDRFYQEKLEFLKKMDSLEWLQSDWLKSREIFVRNVNISEAVSSLARGDRKRCRSMLQPYIPFCAKADLIYGLSWVPLGIRSLRFYRRTKGMC